MPVEKTSDILRDAGRNGYGVAAFNVFNYESIAWAIQAAEEEGIPVIIQFYPGFDEYIPLSTVAAAVKDLARSAKIPVGLHLDHSFSYEQALSGIRHGFLSVMIDGSRLSFEDNVDLTSQVVKAAHALGVEVEGEIGCVGSGSRLDDFKKSDFFTDPEEARLFVERTQVDSLAVSIGNAHGYYAADPSLDIGRLKRIKGMVEVPLVLHGGTGIPDEQMVEAVQAGINKVNIATEYLRVFYDSLKQVMEENKERHMYGCMKKASTAVKEFIKGRLRILNPLGFKVT